MTAPNENVGGMRMLAVDIEGDAPALADEWPLPGVETVAASPYGNAYVVGTADPDGVFQVQSTGESFQAPVAVTLSGPMAQLPSAASVVGRGALRGRVLMAELTGIRQLELAADGSVTDLGEFAVPSSGPDDLGAILGAMGVTP